MKKILIVNANYYKNISSLLLKGANKILVNYKVKIEIINVPGVFEIPTTIRKYIKKYDGFISLGCVIKGETPHFELICKSTFDAIIKLSISFNKPITNGIITALNITQAKNRCSFNPNSRKPNKGLEAAKAIIAVLNNEPKKN
tara:strand:+ start:2254 stop:2682 length:429 start_codon:yes stop_codon:yes gene_type:complete